MDMISFLNVLLLIFNASTNEKVFLPFQCRLNKNIFPESAKLVGYLASAV